MIALLETYDEWANFFEEAELTLGTASDYPWTESSLIKATIRYIKIRINHRPVLLSKLINVFGVLLELILSAPSLTGRLPSLSYLLLLIWDDLPLPNVQVSKWSLMCIYELSHNIILKLPPPSKCDVRALNVLLSEIKLCFFFNFREHFLFITMLHGIYLLSPNEIRWYLGRQITVTLDQIKTTCNLLRPTFISSAEQDRVWALY